MPWICLKISGLPLLDRIHGRRFVKCADWDAAYQSAWLLCTDLSWDAFQVSVRRLLFWWSVARLSNQFLRIPQARFLDPGSDSWRGWAKKRENRYRCRFAIELLISLTLSLSESNLGSSADPLLLDRILLPVDHIILLENWAPILIAWCHYAQDFALFLSWVPANQSRHALGQKWGLVCPCLDLADPGVCRSSEIEPKVILCFPRVRQALPVWNANDLTSPCFCTYLLGQINKSTHQS